MKRGINVKEQLSKYFDSLFESAPDTQAMKDLRDEIYQNTLDRYNDLISQGKSEDESFSKAVSGIGNIEELIKRNDYVGLNENKNCYSRDYVVKNRVISGIILAVSVMLYVGCVIPPVALQNDAGAALMMFAIALGVGMSIFANKMKIKEAKCNAKFRELSTIYGKDYSTERFEKYRLFSSGLLSVGVMLYVMSVVPVILLGNEQGVVLMFVTIAVATALVILYANLGLKLNAPTTESMVGEFMEWSEERKRSYSLIKTIDCIIFVVATVVFLMIGFLFNAWPIAWLVYVIAAVIFQIVKSCFEYICSKD